MDKNIIAEPTAATYDMGLQYDYISDEGAGTAFGLFTEWPAYRIRISSDDLSKIKDKIKNLSLSFEDIKETYFYPFIEDSDFNVKEVSLSEFLENLKDTYDEQHDCIYCLYNYTGPDYLVDTIPVFYSNEKDLLEAFKDKYMNGIRSWYEMNDEEKAYWESRKEEIGEFYYIDFE